MHDMFLKTPILSGKKQIEKFLADNNLCLTQVDSLEKTEVKPVWDVSVITNETDPLSRSIVTNNIVTHNSTTPDYIQNILEAQGSNIDVRHIFGMRHPELQDKWIIPPRMRYYAESEGERFYIAMGQMLKALPDKVCVNGDWYLGFERTKQNISKYKGKYDAKLSSKFGKLMVPSPNGGAIQALIILDSFPAMTPADDDEGEGTKGLALDARMHSKHYKKVRSKLKRKNATLVGVNQIRLNPGARFGNPEYEPCGMAIKHACITGSTLLNTSNGLITARDAFENAPSKAASIKGSERLALFSKMGVSRIWEATLDHGFHVEGKPDHKVYALQPGGIETEWCKLSDIQRNTHVAIKVGSNVWPKKNAKISDFCYVPNATATSKTAHYPFPAAMTTELAELLGLLCADGNLRDNHIRFTTKNVKVKDQVTSLFNSCFSVDLTDEWKLCEDEAWRLDWFSSFIAQYLEYLGCYNKSARQKEVPWCIRRSTKEIVVAFLRNWISLDTSFSPSEAIFTTFSNKALDQIQNLLLNLGIVSSKRFTRSKYTHFDRLQGADDSETGVGGSLYFSGSDYKELVLTLNINMNLTEHGSSVVLKCSSTTKFNLPDSIFDFWRTPLNKYFRWVKEYLKRNTLTAKDLLDKSVIKAFKAYTSTLRTSQQREANILSMEACLAIAKTTVKNNLVWLGVSDVNITEPQMTYDALMPDTHSLITNGIVSHNSDARIRQSPRAIPHGSGQIEEEPSVLVEGGVDQYRYIHARAIKNKLGINNLEAWYRLWMVDGEGKGRGLCPVYDTYQYLKSTGQCTGSMKKMSINTDVLEISNLSWVDFKALILLRGKDLKAHCEELGLKKNPKLREFCFEQVSSGVGIELYYANINGSLQNEDDDDLIDIDGDDDDEI